MANWDISSLTQKIYVLDLLLQIYMFAREIPLFPQVIPQMLYHPAQLYTTFAYPWVLTI